MWRVLHAMLGWHYVHLRNSATQIIRRVMVTAAGERYVRYYDGHLVFIDRAGCGWQVTPLTWSDPIDCPDKPKLRVINE